MEQNNHPYSHTLSLLKLSLDRLPPTFPNKRKKHYIQKLEEFQGNSEIDYKAITEVIVEFGKESWPWRKAYEDLYRSFGRSSEEAHLLEKLDQGLRQKYEGFIHEGGKINHLEKARSEDELYKPAPFERYFTPEEKFGIQQALLTARDSARKEIDGLLTTNKAEEYGKAIEEWLGRQQMIEKKIEELRYLSEVSEKWKSELTDRIRLIEEGWSVVEKGVNEETLDKELEYWRGTLESFLHT